MLKATESEFRRITILRLARAHEWYLLDVEEHQKQTRLMCYFMGNHKATGPEDLWLTPSEIVKRQKDLIEGRIPIAKFKKLTPDEVKDWRFSKQ